MSFGAQPSFQTCNLGARLANGHVFQDDSLPQYIMSSCGAIPGGDPRLRWISFC